MDTKELKFLVFFLAAIALLGFGLSILVAFKSAYQDELFNLDFCFTDDCVGYFVSNLSNSIAIANATLEVLVAVATVGGIIVALLGYLNSSHTSALSNHISHFSIFHSYLNGEVGKLSMVSPESIDVLSFYNFIFHKSRSGKTDVSSDYINFVKDLNSEVITSNGKAKGVQDGAFRYKDHQARLIQLLVRAGITMTYLPRNDFYAAEGQVFSLIEKVNQSFCYSGSVPILESRKYI